MTWFNPPFSKHIASNIGKQFLNVINFVHKALYWSPYHVWFQNAFELYDDLGPIICIKNILMTMHGLLCTVMGHRKQQFRHTKDKLFSDLITLFLVLVQPTWKHDFATLEIAHRLAQQKYKKHKRQMSTHSRHPPPAEGRETLQVLGAVRGGPELYCTRSTMIYMSYTRKKNIEQIV